MFWSPAATPQKANETTDPNAIEVGLKFRSSVPGQITGIRFYKGNLNTGTHVAHLLRRLRRVCNLYGSDPTFVFCSAGVPLM